MIIKLMQQKKLIVCEIISNYSTPPSARRARIHLPCLGRIFANVPQNPPLAGEVSAKPTEG